MCGISMPVRIEGGHIRCYLQKLVTEEMCQFDKALRAGATGLILNDYAVAWIKALVGNDPF